MLRVDGLTKRYLPPSPLLRPFVRVAAAEPVDALRDVSLEVHPGQVVGLVGPNGAGKTTLIKIVATLLEATSGRVEVAGVDTAHAPRAARGHMGLMLADDRGAYVRLTGRQNLEFFGSMAGLDRAAARSRAGFLLERFGLDGADKMVFGYSAGMKSKLGLARALVGSPELLVLDEPTRSLDPVATTEAHAVIAEAAAAGAAVLLSSHRLDEVTSVCDRVVLVVGGEVRFAGPPGEATGLHALLVREMEEP
jgi:ABC-2 type transport system ATP-binding protein